MNTTVQNCEACGLSCVHKIDLFSGLPEDVLLQLLKDTRHFSFQKNEVLFNINDPVDAIYVVHHGQVKLSSYDSDGREQIIGIFGSGDVLWEDLFHSESVYPYSAICLTDVHCCKIQAASLYRGIAEPQIASRIISLLSQKLRDANERSLILSTSDPRSRIAGFLLYRSRHQASDTITLHLDEIAGSISLRAETVSRKLRELEKEGLIRKIGQSGYRILDRESLQELFGNHV